MMNLPKSTRLGVNPRVLRVYLKRGGVIAYPTESTYGLGCLPDNPRAVRQILRIKKRPQHKGLIIIGKNMRQFRPYLFRLPEDTQNQINRIWANFQPTTFLLPIQNQNSVMKNLRGKGRDKLAVRVSPYDYVQNLCGVVGSALVSTSCNRAKKRPTRQARETRRQFGRDVWVLNGRVGGFRQPSQIVDWQTQTRLR